MANKQKGEVDFSVGTKRFSIKLSANAAASAAPYMNGASIFEAQVRNMDHLRALLFATCKGQNGINTIDDAGDLIDEDPIPCAKAIDEALSLFFQRWAQKAETQATP